MHVIINCNRWNGKTIIIKVIEINIKITLYIRTVIMADQASSFIYLAMYKTVQDFLKQHDSVFQSQTIGDKREVCSRQRLPQATRFSLSRPNYLGSTLSMPPPSKTSSSNKIQCVKAKIFGINAKHAAKSSVEKPNVL